MLEALFDRETETWRGETGSDLDETVRFVWVFIRFNQHWLSHLSKPEHLSYHQSQIYVTKTHDIFNSPEARCLLSCYPQLDLFIQSSVLVYPWVISIEILRIDD